MTAYRRLYIPGGTYFFSVALADRSASTLVDEIDLLRSVYGSVMAQHPVICHAMVVLPNQIHAVWTLPEGDADFSIRWKKIKSVFSRHCKAVGSVSQSQARKSEKGLWQRRFWEHVIRSPVDFQNYIDFCHFSPVKHGLVKRPQDWRYSTIHRSNQARRMSA